MRVVIDSNVLISGLLKTYSPPARVVDLLYIGRLKCVYDDRILTEYTEVLSRPKFAAIISARERKDLLGYIGRSGLHILPDSVPEFAYLAPDADDLPFVQAAVSGNAECIITGNFSHFSFFQTNPFNIKVLSPTEFYTLICGGAEDRG